jgi:hypothetical protein
MKNTIFFILIIFIFGLFLNTGCSTKDNSKNSDSSQKTQNQTDEEQAKKEEWEKRIVDSPMLITSEYFRQKSGRDSNEKSISLFTSSNKREKELEERLAALEKRMLDVPERPRDQKGSPILRRKVALLSLLGDTGLDVLAILPSALKRTNGVIPIESEQFSLLLEKLGKKVEDLTFNDTRKEIALKAGIQAFILVYFPIDESVTAKENKNKLRLDVIHATDSTLLASYYSTVDDFDTVSKHISDDIVRSTSWSGRIIQIENNTIYINSGRLTGIQSGDRLKVLTHGKEIYDPLTGKLIGSVPGAPKGEIQVESLFGTDGAKTTIISGNGFDVGDMVEISGLI